MYKKIQEQDELIYLEFSTRNPLSALLPFSGLFVTWSAELFQLRPSNSSPTEFGKAVKYNFFTSISKVDACSQQSETGCAGSLTNELQLGHDSELGLNGSMALASPALLLLHADAWALAPATSRDLRQAGASSSGRIEWKDFGGLTSAISGGNQLRRNSSVESRAARLIVFQ